MKRIMSFLALLCAACTPVITHAPIKSTPDETVACASDLLGSMDYQLLDHDTEVRAERAKHVAFGHQRADYDRITVIVADDKLHVRGETVAVSGGKSGADARRGGIALRGRRDRDVDVEGVARRRAAHRRRMRRELTAG